MHVPRFMRHSVFCLFLFLILS